MITIDGSFGEGGGQIIRTSCALSVITGKPFRVVNVRAKRDKPGLQRQHLTAVHAAAEVGRAEVEGAAVGSAEFTFKPGAVVPGEYAFRIGTAGSTMLVLQTVLPPLMMARGPSTVILEGGTHNVHAPTFEFLHKTFLPLLNRTGHKVSMELERYGFYPPGGGRIRTVIEPAAACERIDLLAFGRLHAMSARALVVNLDPDIAERMLGVVRQCLHWPDEHLQAEISTNAVSRGAVLTLEFSSDHVTEVITGIGERGVRAEAIALRAVEEAQRYIDAAAPVGEHLADQLLLPLALGQGGSYLTGPLSLHTTTNIEIIKMFLEVEISAAQAAELQWRIDVKV